MSVENWKVSIIVPVYNSEKYINRCIKSIVQQTYNNIEIILVNDGSKDESLNICNYYAKLDNRIHIINQENQGVVQARYQGVLKASGELVLFIDSDDWIESNMVEVLATNIGDADIISSDVYWEAYPGKMQIRRDDFEKNEYGIWEEDKGFLSRMIYDYKKHEVQPLTPWIWNKIFRRDKIVPLFENLDNTLFFAEDTLLLYKYILASSKIRFLHEPLYHYCYYPGSLVHTVGYERLEHVGKVYKEAAKMFSGVDSCYGLMGQLNRWIAILTKTALGQNSDPDQLRFLEFLLDISLIGPKDRRVAIYGAGCMGQDYAYQLRKFGYEIPIIVDGSWNYWKEMGQDVYPPDQLKNIEFDVVIVAISNMTIANEVKGKLVELGILEEKILCGESIGL